MFPTFSIVINTLNRASLLRRSLESFRWLKYGGEFEVIVVNGPSTDTTEDVIASWLPHIRVGKCDVANLSVSRNIGICMAQGDLVVFIDDDAYPEPEWLTQHATAFDTAEVGAVGGLVYDHTGYRYQYEYRTANRLLNCNWSSDGSAEHRCFPGSFEFPYPPGGNASFRRSALLDVGGFDEEIEYYGDEVDVCCRLMDAGYLVRLISTAYVYHKSAPNQLRDDQRIVRDHYSIIKNKIYFSLKHGRDYLGISDIFDDNRKFSSSWQQEVKSRIDAGTLSKDELSNFESQNQRAWDVGVRRGLERDFRLITPEGLRWSKNDFLKFSPIENASPRVIVIICQYFPPEKEGGIPTFSKDLAEALAAEGHVVHVITQISDSNRVDLEEGVWVHRIVTHEIQRTPEAIKRDVPQHIWNWSASALQEVKRIATHRRVDIVEAPIWDCQGVAFLLDHQWPLVTNLQTTLHFILDSHPELRSDKTWMNSFGTPMLALEKEMMTKADAVRSISVAIRRDIEAAYGFSFDEDRIVVAPLGMESVRSFSVPAPSSELTVLFVGRLEHRKGIDVLFQAIPKVLEAVPGTRFRILGDDALPAPEGRTYKEAFLTSRNGRRYISRVSFEGVVDNDALRAAYASCDIFVAPSRFESFGLVFLEAMREGKPVIGCLAGGMPEVVTDEINGLLVPPNDSKALEQAIIRLARSAELRQTMGNAGREIFEKRFTSSHMARASSEIYEIAARIFKRNHVVRVSYINGVCVKHDAISSAVRDRIIALRDHGIEDVRLYAYDCQYETLPFCRVTSLTDITTDAHFQSSNLVVFHFGIYQPLFDLLSAAPSKARRLVVFHNITPKEFVSPEHHGLIDKSITQMANIAWADHVICDSETNLSALRSFGIRAPASVIPIAVQVDAAPPPVKPSFRDGISRIVFVGRFVRSKGPQDLLATLERAVDAGLQLPLRLDMVGNLAFSDQQLVEEIREVSRRLERKYAEQLRIRIHGSATDEAKQELLREADLFVLPTYHEGFCVPIVEALATGCKVIAYDNSNTPAISGGLATLTPTGGIEQLALAVKESVERVRSADWQGEGVGSYIEYAKLAHTYTQQFAPKRIGKLFVELVRDLTDPSSRLSTIVLPGIPQFRLETHSKHDQFISAEIMENKSWEPFETRVFRSLCREGDFVLDIGANIGWYSVIGSFSVGQAGHVMSFEPGPDNYQILERNLQRCAATNVQALRIALGAVSTDTNLYLSETNCGDHHLFHDGTVRMTVPIRTDTLDHILADRVRLPEIVKSDTQGSEGLILRGAAHLLAKGWRPVWLLEFWPFGLCKSGTDPLEPVVTLRDLGYLFFEITEQNLKLVKTDPEMLAARVNTDLHPDGARFINLLAVAQNSDRLETLKELFG